MTCCEGKNCGKDATSGVRDLIEGAVADLASASIQLDAVAGRLFRLNEMGAVAKSGAVDYIGILLDRFVGDLRLLKDQVGQ